jgi:type III secretion protein Q
MYRPPRFSRDEIAFRNVICKRREPVAFEWLGALWRLALQMRVEAVVGQVYVEADWGGSRVVMKVSGRWIEQVARALVPDASLTSLPEPLMLAILESAFASASDLIGSKTKKRFRIVAAGTKPRSTEGLTCFGFRLERDGETVVGEVWFDALGMGFLASALRGQRALRDGSAFWERLEIPLRFEVGWTDLATSSLQGIEPHDVILLDECWVSEQRVRVKVGGGCLFEAMLEGMQMTVMTELEEALDGGDDLVDGGDWTDEGDRLEHLQVRLTFDLGERMMTLASLQEIGPGHIFDLGRDLRRAVIIRANGRAVGEGELVEIDGRIGVSVMAFGRAAD